MNAMYSTDDETSRQERRLLGVIVIDFVDHTVWSLVGGTGHSTDVVEERQKSHT